MTSTMPGRVGVLSDLRLLFGPEIEDREIERVLEVAICDVQEIGTADHLLSEAGRLAQLRLDALARRDVLGR